MKYLIVIVVVMVGVWLLIRSRRTAPPPRAQKGVDREKGAAGPQAMVNCRHCGVHLPLSEALVGKDGMFCSEQHRLAGPRAN
ncbi:MAG: hypothetical protein KF720_10040 [Rubrivivax sp.]|nr:hypothetical protein [Rubrivivax sp.]